MKEDIYELDTLIRILEGISDRGNNIAVNFPKALLSLAKEIKRVDNSIERLDDEIRGYDP